MCRSISDIDIGDMQQEVDLRNENVDHFRPLKLGKEQVEKIYLLFQLNEL